MFNVLAWMHEIETGSRYQLARAHDPCSGLGSAATAAAPVDVEEVSKKDADAEGTDAAGAGAGDAVGEEEAKAETDADDADDADDAATCTTADKPGGAPGDAAPSPDVPPGVYADAVHRARQIVKALRGVKVLPLTGQFKDVLTKVSRSSVKFDVVSMSCHAAHHMALEELPGVLADDAVLQVELARNVVDFTDDQRTLFAQHAVKMAGDHGAAFAGTDRSLSSDTFTKGTVLVAGRMQQEIEAEKKARDKQLALVDAVAKTYAEGAETLPADAASAAARMVRGAVLATNRDTQGGDQPKPQRLVFTWNRARAATRAKAFKKLWDHTAPMKPVQARMQAAEDKARVLKAGKAKLAAQAAASHGK